MINLHIYANLDVCGARQSSLFLSNTLSKYITSACTSMCVYARECAFVILCFRFQCLGFSHLLCCWSSSSSRLHLYVCYVCLRARIHSICVCNLFITGVYNQYSYIPICYIVLYSYMRHKINRYVILHIQRYRSFMHFCLGFRRRRHPRTLPSLLLS